MTRGIRRDGNPKKRGEKWSVEEHNLFLTGVRACGRGQWRQISKDFVQTRTPVQVASHAQKHFDKIARSTSKSGDEADGGATEKTKQIKQTTERAHEGRKMQELTLLACHFYYGFFMGFFNTFFYFYVLHKLLFASRPVHKA